MIVQREKNRNNNLKTEMDTQTLQENYKIANLTYQSIRKQTDDAKKDMDLLTHRGWLQPYISSASSSLTLAATAILQGEGDSFTEHLNEAIINLDIYYGLKARYTFLYRASLGT